MEARVKETCRAEALKTSGPLPQWSFCLRHPSNLLHEELHCWRHCKLQTKAYKESAAEYLGSGGLELSKAVGLLSSKPLLSRFLPAASLGATCSFTRELEVQRVEVK